MCTCGGSTDWETGIYEPACSHLHGSVSGRGLGRVGQHDPVLYIETSHATYHVHHGALGRLDVCVVVEYEGSATDWTEWMGCMRVPPLPREEVDFLRRPIEVLPASLLDAQWEVSPLVPAFDGPLPLFPLDEGLCFLVSFYEQHLAERVLLAVEEAA